MVADGRAGRMKAHILPLLSVVAGALAAATVAGAPAPLLADWLTAAGLPAVLPAAAPPLGVTGRTLLGILVGVVVAAIGLVRLPRRNVDRHPDHPPRRPIHASEDLGPPLPILPIARPIPRDLDTPMSRLDPAAVPDVPREPVRPVRSLRPQIIEPGERFETFALPRNGMDAPATIGSLIDRLERIDRHRPASRPADAYPRRHLAAG